MFPNLKKGLRIKLTVAVLGAILLTSLFTNLLYYFYNNQNINYEIIFISIIFPAFFSIAVIVLIWWFLNPLNKLYEGAQILARGELRHRIDINSNDEISYIAQILNQSAKNLAEIMQKNAYDKDVLSSEKHKLNTIISSILDGIIVLDLHKKIILANKSAEKLIGKSAEEVTGKLLNEILLISYQSGQPFSLDKYLSIASGEQPTSKIPEMVIVTGPNGQKTEIRLTVAQIAAEGIRSDLGIILIFHDVTSEKMLEQMQIDFVSMASHEVRTPLTSIINYLSTLSEETKTVLNDEQKEFLTRALSSAQELSSLVNNLLNVSKVERGSYSLSLKPLDWTTRLTQLVEDNRAQAVQKNISLTLKLPDEPVPQVLADDVRINEVVNNLINNALTYTKEGGSIEVGIKVSPQEVLTYVADNGIGIPQSALPYLFSKFFRVPGALEQMNKGTGLGLYISKSIIELHHGKVWVESKVGEGSTFYFTLQVAKTFGTTPTIVQLKHADFR